MTSERFLLSADVVEMQALEVGITRPYQATLTDGRHTLKATWKTIDELDSVLEKLRRLDEPTLGETLGEWLTVFEIRAILKRRNRIVDLAERLIAERGEGAVVHP